MLHEDALGNALVHRESRAEIARAGVFESEQVERRLNLTVLTRAAVEREEDDVGAGADVDDILTQPAVGFVASLFAHLLDVGDGVADLDGVGEAVILLEERVHVADILLVALEHVEQNDLVTFFSESGGDEKSRRDRDVTLGTGAARKNDYSHK